MFLNSKQYQSFWLNGKEYDKGFLNGKQIFGETLHSHTIRILARATAIGATPPTNITIFDTYVRSMVAIWTEYCDIFFRFRGTGDAKFKQINLAKPEGALADFYGGYTLDILGFKGNGVNAYVDTNFNPSLLVAGQKYQLNNASRGAIIISSITYEGNVQQSSIDGISNKLSNNLLNTSHVAQRINQGTSSLPKAFDFSRNGMKIISRYGSVVYKINKELNESVNLVSSSLENGNQSIFRRGSNLSLIHI